MALFSTCIPHSLYFEKTRLESLIVKKTQKKHSIYLFIIPIPIPTLHNNVSKETNLPTGQKKTYVMVICVAKSFKMEKHQLLLVVAAVLLICKSSHHANQQNTVYYSKLRLLRIE